MVAQTSDKMRALALKLFEINAFKFGDFKMKVGINSPVYFDLRVIVSYPDVMVSGGRPPAGIPNINPVSTTCGIPVANRVRSAGGAH